MSGLPAGLSARKEEPVWVFHPDASVRWTPGVLELTLLLGAGGVSLTPVDAHEATEIQAAAAANQNAVRLLLQSIPARARLRVLRALRAARVVVRRSELELGCGQPFDLYLNAAFSNPRQVASRLGRLTVGIVGLGGLGSHLVVACAGSGVRRMRLADGGVLSQGDQFRQPAYLGASVGAPKAELLNSLIRQVEPSVNVAVNDCDLMDSADVHDFCEGIDLLVWLADTLDYRLVYGAARRAGVPVVSAAIGIKLWICRSVSGSKTGCLFPMYQSQ